MGVDSDDVIIVVGLDDLEPIDTSPVNVEVPETDKLFLNVKLSVVNVSAGVPLVTDSNFVLLDVVDWLPKYNVPAVVCIPPSALIGPENVCVLLATNVLLSSSFA